MKSTAIVLAAGKGTRMNSDTAKQYMLLAGKPVLYYALKAFERSEVDEVIVVAGANDIKFVQETIIDKYGFEKVKKVVSGGAYRFSSVWEGLNAASPDSEYILIHDGARPMITPEMIHTLLTELKVKKAVVAACPNKDTVKIVNEDGIVISTPKRETIWKVQTPQCFSREIIYDAYKALIALQDLSATDDAMVVEKYTSHPVYLVDTGDTNIKITTPSDLYLCESLLNKL